MNALAWMLLAQVFFASGWQIAGSLLVIGSSLLLTAGRRPNSS